MKGSRFSEEQIIENLREQEAGSKAADVCRKRGGSEAAFYKWKAKFGGMEVSDARRLRQLGHRLIMPQPDADCGELDEGKIVGGSLLVSGRGWRGSA